MTKSQTSDTNEKPEKESYSLVEVYFRQMKLIEDRTGVPGYVVLTFLSLAILFVFFGFMERFITNLVGTLYPAFWTIKSIEKKGEDDKDWLTYWVVFAFFTVVDVFSGSVLKLIPFYFFFKIVFLIWLFMPNSGGAHLVYHILVVRLFRSVERDIDSAGDKLGEYASGIINKGKDAIETRVKNVTIKAITGVFVNVTSEEVEVADSNPFKTDKAENLNNENLNNERKLDNLNNDRNVDNLNNETISENLHNTKITTSQNVTNIKVIQDNINKHKTTNTNTNANAMHKSTKSIDDNNRKSDVKDVKDVKRELKKNKKNN